LAKNANVLSTRGQVPALAKRRNVEAKKDSATAPELLANQVGTHDQAELCKLLLEIGLLDSAYQRSSTSRDAVCPVQHVKGAHGCAA
jgi:hypothetical protein